MRLSIHFGGGRLTMFFGLSGTKANIPVYFSLFVKFLGLIALIYKNNN